MQKKFQFIKVLELNFAMILISTSGALGRYISLPPALTIFWRTLLAAFFIYLFCRFRKISLRVGNKSDFFKIVLSGIFMGLHWVTYFYALQLSNVAIGMLSIFTYPVITALLESLILKSKFKLAHLGLGVLVLMGIYFLVPNFSFDNTYTKAVGFGMFSALSYALRNILMKPQIEKYNGFMLMQYQILVVVVLLSPVLLIYKQFDMSGQWIPILTLALVTTTLGHTLFLMSFRNFSITTASIMSSTQPVFGIIIGMIFLREYPSLTTIFGGLLILIAVIIESIRSAKEKP